MNRSIVLASLVLAGLFSTLNANASESITSGAQPQMCKEITYKEYLRQNHGPAGKYVEIVKVTKRTRLACNGTAGSKQPVRTAAVMHHYKSV